MAESETQTKETYFAAQNAFFFDKYKKLKRFAVSPYSWDFFYDDKKPSDSLANDVVACGSDLALKACLSPILLPATVVTAGIALVLAVATFVCHVISSIVSTVLDAPSISMAYGMPVLPMMMGPMAIAY